MTLKGYDKEKTFKNVMMILIPKAFPKTVAVPRIGILILPNQAKEATKINFYNNDDAKSFKVTIIGFDEETDTPLYYNDILK